MDLLERLQKQAEQVEVVDLQTEATAVTFEASRFKASRVQETRGTAVRIVRSGRLGFAVSTDEGAQERLLTNVLESAAAGPEVPLVFPGPRPASPVRAFDPAVAGLPMARMVQIGQEAVDLILSADPGLQVDVQVTKTVQRTAVRTGSGADVSFQLSSLSLGADLVRIEGDDILVIFDSQATAVWDDDYLAFARRMVDRFKLARNVVPARSATLPVLFSPMGSAALMLPLLEGLNGKNAFTRTSPLLGKTGEKLFDAKLTVVDDGTLDGRPGSAPYDDEGVPHRQNVLVDQGVCRGFFYDLKTAAQSGVDSSGNGTRGLFTPPTPSVTNLIVAAGETPLAGILAGIDEGLWVEIPLGLGQGNIISGAFSNPLALAFKIEKGEVVGRVKDVSIAGNIYELLREIAAVSRESLWVNDTYRLPYVLLPAVNVVAKQ